MPIDPSSFDQNEAWILFRLNGAPIRTEADGDFNAMAIMEVTSGMIFGMELVPIAHKEISELQARKLLNSSANQAGGRPVSLFIATEEQAAQISTAAETMKIEVKRVAASDFSEITKEARDGFANHVSCGSAP
ncbi:MAG: DUF6930 domain-containing protein [Gammaproteobacteria bacterium]|nr:hypothetical protein [Gammaproteobacteria bacterium]